MTVFIVIPFLAIFKPIDRGENNVFSFFTLRVHPTIEKASMRILAIGLMMIFAIPALIMLGQGYARSETWLEVLTNVSLFFNDPHYYRGDIVWLVGLALIPVGLLAISVLAASIIMVMLDHKHTEVHTEVDR